MRHYLSSQLATEPQSPRKERRRSERWWTNQKIEWRLHRGRRLRESRLVQRSLHGLVLMTDQKDTPDIGKRLAPHADQEVDRYGFRSAVVRRVVPLAGRMNLIYAEIEA